MIKDFWCSSFSKVKDVEIIKNPQKEIKNEEPNEKKEKGLKKDQKKVRDNPSIC